MTEQRTAELLRQMHGPTHCISGAMRRLTPFPDAPTLADAHVLDLAITAAPGAAHASIRYATRTCFAAAVDQLQNQLEGTVIESSDDMAVVERHDNRITIHDYTSFRSIRVSACIGSIDPAKLVRRFGAWHGGTSPLPSDYQVGISIETFADGRAPAATTLYTSHFRLGTTQVDAVRPAIESRLEADGWTTSEPQPGILFLRGPFDAELHLYEEDSSACIDFVGEFSLNTRLVREGLLRGT